MWDRWDDAMDDADDEHTVLRDRADELVAKLRAKGLDPAPKPSLPYTPSKLSWQDDRVSEKHHEHREYRAWIAALEQQLATSA